MRLAGREAEQAINEFPCLQRRNVHELRNGEKPSRLAPLEGCAVLRGKRALEEHLEEHRLEVARDAQGI